jgi:DNA-binding CsgD family transcriptional regulator
VLQVKEPYYSCAYQSIREEISSAEEKSEIHIVIADDHLTSLSCRKGYASYWRRPTKVLCWWVTPATELWHANVTGAAHGVSSANNAHRETDLTERELEVLASLVRGKRNKEIAIYLGVSARTVRAHLSTIYMKLNVASQAQAVAIERGLLSSRS